MGYRHKIGKMPKELFNRIKDVQSKKELFTLLNKEWKEDVEDEDTQWENRYLGSYEITKEIFELGKYVDDAYLKPFSSRIFSNEDLHNEYNPTESYEGTFYVLSREGFKAIIQDYHKKIYNYFKGLQEGTEDIKGYLFDKVYEWDQPIHMGNHQVNPYFLDEYEVTDPHYQTVVRSWKYEYEIFELVRLYKSIDWENEVVTITAW